MAKLFEINFGFNVFPDEYNDIIHLDEFIDDYNYLIKNASRGDLVLNISRPDYRNYNLGIINFVNNKIYIEELDDYECYNGFPRLPIHYLDILMINPNYWRNRLSLYDDELEKYSISDNIQLEKIKYYHIDNNIISILVNHNLPLILYKNIYKYIEYPEYLKIVNTNFIIKNLNHLDKEDIIRIIYDGISYDSKQLLNYDKINNIIMI